MAEPIPMLYSAVANRHTEVVKLLLSRKGVDVNEQTKTGATALNVAASDGETEIFKLLIDAKANVQSRTGDGKTPLYSAALNGQVLALVAAVAGRPGPCCTQFYEHKFFWIINLCGGPHKKSIIHRLIHSRVIFDPDSCAFISLHFVSTIGLIPPPASPLELGLGQTWAGKRRELHY
jgi:Ankyrin repeats (3 copies)